MIFKQFYDEQSSTYTYIIGSEKNKESLIIDSVADNVDEYLDFLNQYELKLLFALDTHIHADHISGMSLLHDKTGCKLIMGEHTTAEGLTRKLQNNEEFRVGDMIVKVIFTPGHTSDSYCFLIDDMLFTGDTLLIGETGRTDFQNGNSESAYNSLFNIILKFPDDTKIYPGHDYNGKKSSTVGYEKKTNPRLQVKSKEEYTNLMSKLNLPKPKKIDIAIPRNKKLGKK